MLIYLSLLETEKDKSKFAIIYEEYRGLMFHVANDILHDEKESEDVVHNAFIKIIKIIEKIDTPMCPKTRGLIVTIVERTAIDVYRHRKKREICQFDEEYINVPAEDEITKIEKSNSIQKAIALLPTRYREILILKYDNGLTDIQISDILSISTDNVHKTTQRAKKRLQEILESMEIE